MKTRAAVLLCLIAVAMLLPVSTSVNTHLVNRNANFADGTGAPPPPTPPVSHLA